MTLDQLFDIVRGRKANPSAGSYTGQLLAKGDDEIIKKVGEEAIEVILAAKGQGDQRVVEELADLYFHTLVLLVARGLSLGDVEEELTRRHAARPAAALGSSK